MTKKLKRAFLDPIHIMWYEAPDDLVDAFLAVRDADPDSAGDDVYEMEWDGRICYVQNVDGKIIFATAIESL